MLGLCVRFIREVVGMGVSLKVYSTKVITFRGVMSGGLSKDDEDFDPTMELIARYVEIFET